MKKAFLVIFFLLLIQTSFAQLQNTTREQSIAENTISVTIGGNFIVTGSFNALITERVDQLITRVYNNGRAAIVEAYKNTPWLLEKEFEKYSFRKVTLKRADGKVLELNLEKFRREGDFSNNPYLKNDDVLIFPPSDIENKFFVVSGGVNKPGKYLLFDNDNLQDAIYAAQGLNTSYNVDKIRIHRLTYKGDSLYSFDVDVNSTAKLEAGDRIVVGTEAPVKDDYQVEVIGEVKNPGEIPISRNASTLYEVIERAGGLTDKAWLKMAKVYSSESIPAQMKINENRIQNPEASLAELPIVEKEAVFFSRLSEFYNKDTTYFFAENKYRITSAPAIQDLSALADPNSKLSKYVLKDKDIVVIPKKSNNVYVFGQVGNAGNVTFQSGKDFDYYIQQAGGTTKFAEHERIAVVKGSTGKWHYIEEEKVEIEPGDYLYVPKEQLLTFDEEAMRVGNYLSIVGSAATIILLLIQLGK